MSPQLTVHLAPFILWRAQDFGESSVQLCYTGIESVGKSGPYSLYLAIVTVQATPFISWGNLYFVHIDVMIISLPQVKGQGNKITRCPRALCFTGIKSVGKSGPYSSYLPTVTVHPAPFILWRAQDFGESRVQHCYTGIESVGKSGPYSLYIPTVTVQPTPFISWENLYFVHVVVMIISSPQFKGQGNKITRCPRGIKCREIGSLQLQCTTPTSFYGELKTLGSQVCNFAIQVSKV